MNINYEYYRIFYYAAKFKNLTQAAQAANSNQPNISRIIKLIEHELGCNLMIRSNRGITLTPEGERLYSHVKIAVEQLKLAEEELQMTTDLKEGFITIGVTETALHLLLLPVLNQFKKQYPKIHIRILNHLTNQAIDSVKTKLVDFAVIATPPYIDKSLNPYPLMKFRDILIGGPSYAHHENIPVSLKELSHYPLVCLNENTMTYQFYEDFYRRNHLIFKPELEVAATDQILPIIKNDLGVGFIPEIFVKDALSKGDVHQLLLTEEIPSRQICLIENKNHPLSIAARELKKMLMQYG